MLNISEELKNHFSTFSITETEKETLLFKDDFLVEYYRAGNTVTVYKKAGNIHTTLAVFYCSNWASNMDIINLIHSIVDAPVVEEEAPKYKHTFTFEDLNFIFNGRGLQAKIILPNKHTFSVVTIDTKLLKEGETAGYYINDKYPYEVAVISPEGRFLREDNIDDVHAYCSKAEVEEILKWAQTL